MKKLSQIFEAKLNIQDETVNFINKTDLKKYLEATPRFISDDARLVINYLIDHNDYVKQFGNGDMNNALANFYSKQVPSDPELKEVYKAIGRLNKNNRLLEIPVFQSKEQFEGILDHTINPDDVLLDLESERGRNEVVKKYEKLAWKVAREYQDKSTFGLDDLYAYAMEGLTNAMNWFGKKDKVKEQISNLQNKINNCKDEEEKKALEEELASVKDNVTKRKCFTFTNYAKQVMRFTIIGAIRNESHTVRIPVSAQAKEKAERGSNTISNTVSGDKGIGSDSDGNEKSMFDKLSTSMDMTDSESNINSSDSKKIWADIDKKLRKKFSERDINIFYDVWGIFGHEKLKGQEVAKKYGFKSKSMATNISAKIMGEIQKDKELKELFTDAYELMHESKSIMDANDHTGQVYYV